MAEQQSKTEPATGGGVPPKDRYPRMILVCIGISMTLFILITATLLVDFAIRSGTEKPEAAPDSFKGLLEAPRDAYETAPQAGSN